MATTQARLKELTMAQADRLFSSGKGRPEQFGMTTPEAVFAALTSIQFGTGTTGGLDIASPPQWVGESINKARYRRSISALVNHEDLTSPRLLGYDASNVTPTGGTRNQAGGATTSGAIQMVAWGPYDVYSWSTADAFDRTLTDFGIDGNALSTYTRRAWEVYSQWVDNRVFDVVLGGSIAVSASATLGALNTQWAALIDGIEHVLPNAIPTFGLVPVAAIGPMLKAVPPGVIDLIKELTGGDFQLRADTAGRLVTGQTLVGTQGGLDLYELPGGDSSANLRVSAKNLQIGTTDVGVFGYAYPHYLGDDFFALVTAGS